jgi:acyl-coenzyme A thioesterase 13
MSEVPAGFTLSARRSRFLDLLGDVYESGAGAQYRMGVRLADQHTNFFKTAHGGFFCTLLDVYLGRLIAYSLTPPRGFVTVSLTTDFLGAAKIGQWMECSGRVDRVGKSLSHSSGLVSADGEPVARGSGIYRVMATPMPERA